MKKTLVTILAVLMTLSLAACGGGNQQSAAPDTTAPDTTAPDTAVDDYDDEDVDYEEDDDTADTGDGGTVVEYDLDTIYANVEEAYYGSTENGEIIGFGVNGDGSFAVMLFGGEEEHFAFVGAAVIDDEGLTTVTDELSGLAIQFIATPVEDGVYIDLGDMGVGGITPCSVDDLVTLLEEIVTNTYAVG